MIAIIAITSLVANATGRQYGIMLYKQNFDIEPFHIKDEWLSGNRFNSIYENGSVSQEDGVVIEGLSNDILVYEIWDAEGTMCLAYFTDEESFLECLFSMSGDFILKFYFEDYVLYGDISL